MASAGQRGRMSTTTGLLIASTLALAGGLTQAVAPPTFARVAYHRVAPGAEAEFERFMREAWRPIFQSERQSGRLVDWMLYRVHLTGSLDEYNYASVTYHDTWARTDGPANWIGISPEGRSAQTANITARTQTLGPIVRRALFGRVDSVSSAAPQQFKYAVLDFMKVRDGMLDEYLKVEREDWKPLHQVLTNDGNRVGWMLWDYLVPGGTGSPYDFVTTMLFTDYGAIKAANDAEAYKRAHPTGDLAASVARTRRSRDVVRTEIWEVVDSLN
jgi:hypothetical protein